MTKHNEDILNCLNDYLKVSKPGYAVLIKGSWGCGKTYFVKNWIEALKVEKNDNEQFFTLDPIYVSLYGMTSTGLIEEELKRAVSPILHSKAMKMAGKVFKIAISAALRYNIDLNNDGEADMKMECAIDPKALLGSDDPHVKGTRLLVFDDLERSNMNMKDVLGYINYYVEHIGCSVVIVGDDSKLNRITGKRFLILPATNEDIYPLIILERALLILLCRESEEFRAGQASTTLC